MQLVEILLPVSDNSGRRFDDEKMQTVRDELTRRFGGVTAFSRAPAAGSSAARGTVVHDDIVIFEVMTDALDRAWWRAYREQLEREFEQDEIVIRSTSIERL